MQDIQVAQWDSSVVELDKQVVERDIQVVEQDNQVVEWDTQVLVGAAVPLSVCMVADSQFFTALCCCKKD